MPRTTMQTAQMIMNAIRENGIQHEQEIKLGLVREFISRYGGAVPATVDRYIKFLVEMRMIKITENGNFRPDFERTAELSL